MQRHCHKELPDPGLGLLQPYGQPLEQIVGGQGHHGEEGAEGGLEGGRGVGGGRGESQDVAGGVGGGVGVGGLGGGGRR